MTSDKIEPLDHLSNIDEYSKLLDEAVKEGKNTARERIDILDRSQALHDSIVEEKFQRDTNTLFPPTKDPDLAVASEIWRSELINREHITWLVLWHVWFFACLWAI